jgi:AraC-like DNA-binding protein
LERGVGDVVELGAASAATLADALTFLSRHICILNEAAEFGLWVDGEVACFELRSSVYVPRALRDFQLGAVFFAMRKWLGELCDSQICFAYREPSDGALHRSLFAPSVVRFETPCDRILLKASSLALPLCSRDAAIHRVLSRHAQQLESEHNADDGLARRVRAGLLDLLSCGKGDADEIARRLGVSRRTLTRHLAREGVNFRQLLEEVRHQSALRFLETTNIELSRIAVMLGYTDTSSFCRAFIRWSGRSPLAYRRAFRAGLSSLRSEVYSC